LICPLCHTNQSITAAPFIEDSSKWVIYRTNYVEVLVVIIGEQPLSNKKETIVSSTLPLTMLEINYFKKYVLGYKKNKDV
jgi:hypothetical protein